MFRQNCDFVSLFLICGVFLVLFHLTTGKPGAFRRVSDGVHRSRCSQCQSDTSSFRNRHRCLYADGRMHFLSLKGKRQPTYGSYHETALHGGYLSVAGINENSSDISNNNNTVSSPARIWTWSHTHFDPIDKNENREDAFFVIKNHLFLLVYSRFDNVTYRHLYTWQQQSEQQVTPNGIWTVVPLDVDSGSQILAGNVYNGDVAWTVVANPRTIDNNDNDNNNNTTNGEMYLAATDGWGRIVVSKLIVNFSSSSTTNRPISAAIHFLLDQPTSNIDSAGSIVALANHNRRLFAFYGSQGCGFHWNKVQLVVIDLRTLDIDYINLTSRGIDNFSKDKNSPPWAYNGPAFVEQSGADWLMFGGSVPAAHSIGTEFDRQVWVFNLDELRWRKSTRAIVPTQLNPYDTCSAIDHTANKVYLADFRNGIYEVPVSYARYYT